MKSLKQNLIYNLLYQLFIFMVPLITTPYLARILGKEMIGIYSYHYSVAYYFVLFGMLGLNNYGNREIAKIRDDDEKKNKTFWSIYGLQIITGVIFSLLFILYNIIFNSNDIMSWIMIIYVISVIFDINWFFWGLEEFKLTVIRNVLIKLFSVVLILLFVKDKTDIYLYGIIMTLSMLVSVLVLWPYLKGRVSFYKPTWIEIKKHIKPNLILFIPVIAVSIYKVMDKVMLGNLASFQEVGLYDYAEKIIAIPIACVNALGTVMLPRMSNLAGKNMCEKESNIVEKSLVVGLFLSSSMAFGLMAIADIFVPFFYGQGYEKCIILFYILLPSCMFLAVANVIRTQYLIPHCKDKIYVVSIVLGAIVNLIINILLIPNLKSIGAAIGTLIAEMTVCTYQLVCVRNSLSIKKLYSDMISIILITGIMFLVVYFIPYFKNDILTLIIKILVGCIICFIGLMLKYKNKRSYNI